MPTLYFDHNVVHYYVRGFPKTGRISQHTERQALDRARSIANLRFVISDWNLVEPTFQREATGTTDALMHRYAEFFTSLTPLYLSSRESIEREEMKRVVYSHLGLSCPADPPPVFNETFLQACAVSQYSEILLGYDAEKFMLHLARDETMRKHYRDAEEGAT